MILYIQKIYSMINLRIKKVIEVYNRMIKKFLGFEWMDNHDFRFAGGIKFSEKRSNLCNNLIKNCNYQKMEIILHLKRKMIQKMLW